jgi:UDP-glucose 4-epimerase
MSNSKKILVTGGCGFIGSHTVVALIESGFTPVIVDSLENSEYFILTNLEKLTNSKIQFYKANCKDKKTMQTIFEKENFSGIIHFAAYKAVGESVEQPLKYYENNINSLLVLLELSLEFKISNFIFSSSCTVYGSPEIIPVTENSPVGKIASPYGNTKIICENILTDFSNSANWFKPVILRYFNPIGSHPSGTIGELPIGIPNNLVPFINQTAKGLRKELTIFGNDYNTPDGTCIRDFIHVCDLASAHVHALKKIDSFNEFPALFNLGTGSGNSVLEVIKTFEEVNKVKVNYSVGNRRQGDIESIFANNTKAEKELDWTCKYSLKDALAHSWKWENHYSTVKK